MSKKWKNGPLHLLFYCWKMRIRNGFISNLTNIKTVLKHRLLLKLSTEVYYFVRLKCK